MNPHVEHFERERHEILQTKAGGIAIQYYYLWVGDQVVDHMREWLFMHSRYFSTFVKFGRYVLDHPIDDPEKFVMVMREEGTSPSLWRSADAYMLYHIQKNVSTTHGYS